jgi:hypothetical protein
MGAVLRCPVERMRRVMDGAVDHFESSSERMRKGT